MGQDIPSTADSPATGGARAALVVLLLPLSGRTSAPAEAIRDGFLSAYLALDPSMRPRLMIRDCSHGAAQAYQDAVLAGASFIVGPLTKEEVAATVAVAAPQVITLVLNVVPAATLTPPRFYQFALAPEDEARQVALRLLAEGKRSGVALVPAGDWGRRVLEAFDTAFSAGGGKLLVQKTYAPGTTDYAGVIGDLIGFDESRTRYRAVAAAVGVPLEFAPRRREAVGFLFLAGQPVQGRLIRPQLKFHYAGELPLYSISDMYEPSTAANQDLDGLIFPDMPWMLADDAATLGAREESQELWSESTRHRSRLYAFGADAFRLLEELKSPETFRDSVSGLTGRLALDAGGQIRRTLDWAQIQADGTVRPAPAPQP